MTTTRQPSAAQTERRSTGRTIAAVIVILVGLVLIGTTVVNNLFEVGPAFEEMIDDFRPVLTEESLDTARTDIASLEAAGAEFQTVVAPTIAQAMGMSVEDFGSMVATNYPNVATGMQALPEITATFSGLVDTLDSQRDLFASADAIPTDDLPATTVPWIIAISGLLAVVVGGLMFLRGRAWPIAAVVLGGVILVASFALSLPQKAADADELNENLMPIYTQELIDGATTSLGIVAAMGEEMQTSMLPDLAAQMGMSPDQLGSFMAENFPATAAAMQTMPESLERFNGFVGVFETNLDNYETIQSVTFTPIIWTMIVGAIVIILAGGAVLVLER